MSYTRCNNGRMNELITILLGAVLPLITAIWQISRCAKIVRRMHEQRKHDSMSSGRMLNVSIYS